MADIVNVTERDDSKLDLLRQLAEMAQWCPDLDKLPERVENLYKAVLVSSSYSLCPKSGCADEQFIFPLSQERVCW